MPAGDLQVVFSNSPSPPPDHEPQALSFARTYWAVIPRFGALGATSIKGYPTDSANIVFFIPNIPLPQAYRGPSGRGEKK